MMGQIFKTVSVAVEEGIPMAKGIRSYGAGKFHTILDSHAYEWGLDGVDEEISLGDGGGWYGLIQLGADGVDGIIKTAKEQKDPLTPDEETFLEGQAAVIFFERSDGIVEATWYGDERAAQEDWEEIKAEFEEEEDDELDKELVELANEYGLEEALHEFANGAITAKQLVARFSSVDATEDDLELVRDLTSRVDR